MRLSLDTCQPRADRRIAPQLEAALAGRVCVGIQRDVGNGIGIGDEKRALRQMLLHDGERLRPALVQARQLTATCMLSRQHRANKSRHGNVGLVAVLLEEHPLQDLGAGPLVLWPEGRAFGQIEQDRVRLRQELSGLELEQRYAPVRILRQELARARQATAGIELDPLIRALQLLEQ